MTLTEPAQAPGDTTLSGILGATQSRYHIVTFLLQRPDGATSSQVARHIGMTRPATSRMLRALADAGVCTCDTDPAYSPKGQRPMYRMNRAMVITALTEFAQHAGVSVIESADIQPDQIRQQISAKLRDCLNLIAQVDG